MSYAFEEVAPASARTENQAAFTDAWKRFHERLRVLCLRWAGGHPADADDVLGRVAVRALEDIGSREEVISSYPAWLTRMAWNVAMDMHRERACRAQAAERYLELVCDQGRPQADSAESEHLLAEMRAGVRAAVDRLPPRLRQVSVRRLLDEAEYEEIAHEAGITEENARKRIQEARAILARRLTAVRAP